MVKIITPYVNDAEIALHMETFWEYDIYYEKDEAGIGSDLMFEKMWNKFPEEDIFILHADMAPYGPQWLEETLEYVNKHPEAGMFGLLLLYPAKAEDGSYYIQSAGGRFTEDRPDHYGSGINIDPETGMGNTFKEQLETDTGDYDTVREVAWTTFGGCYLRRSFINSVGGFSPEFEWTYNRDVDFCLNARASGQKIYQIPVRMFHQESRDNKVIKAQDPRKLQMEFRNLVRLVDKWSNTPQWKTLDIII
jgi:GT2 family glycosyltransferase